MRLTMLAAVLAFALAGTVPRAALAQYSVRSGHVHAPRTHRERSSHAGAHRRRSSTHHRIHRSRAAKDAFERATGHPHGWPGHVVDHIVPLACGGADDPGNMQWQTTADGKAKDKVERKGCARAP